MVRNATQHNRHGRWSAPSEGNVDPFPSWTLRVHRAQPYFFDWSGLCLTNGWTRTFTLRWKGGSGSHLWSLTAEGNLWPHSPPSFPLPGLTPQRTRGEGESRSSLQRMHRVRQRQEFSRISRQARVPCCSQEKKSPKYYETQTMVFTPEFFQPRKPSQYFARSL